MPETAEEAEALVVEHLTAGSWKAVWSVWRQSRGLRTEPEEMQSLSLAEKDLADLTAILDAYCKHMADSREGESWLERKKLTTNKFVRNLCDDCELCGPWTGLLQPDGHQPSASRQCQKAGAVSHTGGLSALALPSLLLHF